MATTELQLREESALSFQGASTEGHVVGWIDKKTGQTREMTAEGVLWKGGEALKSYKDQALESALAKAVGGRYRAAYDVFIAAFPGIERALEKLHVGTPYANKSSFGTVLMAVVGQQPGAGKTWKDESKQVKAQHLARAIMNIPTFEHLKPQGEVIDN